MLIPFINIISILRLIFYLFLKMRLVILRGEITLSLKQGNPMKPTHLISSLFTVFTLVACGNGSSEMIEISPDEGMESPNTSSLLGKKKEGKGSKDSGKEDQSLPVELKVVGLEGWCLTGKEAPIKYPKSKEDVGIVTHSVSEKNFHFILKGYFDKKSGYLAAESVCKKAGLPGVAEIRFIYEDLNSPQPPKKM